MSTKAIDETRCTSVALRALGIPFGETPMDGIHMLSLIRKAGVPMGIFGMRGNESFDADQKWINGAATVRAFVAAHPTGRYYISTRGHAMAVSDGVLTDAAGRGIDGRRVQMVVAL